MNKNEETANSDKGRFIKNNREGLGKSFGTLLALVIGLLIVGCLTASIVGMKTFKDLVEGVQTKEEQVQPEEQISRTAHEFQVPVQLGVYTETENEKVRPYWIPDKRTQVSWVDPMQLLAFVPISETVDQLQKIGTLPPNTWCNTLGEQEGGLLPVEIELVVPQAVVTLDEEKYEVRYQEAIDRPAELRIQAFQEWLRNGLVHFERREVLKDPGYSWFKVGQIKNDASWDEGPLWERVVVMAWVNVGISESPETINRAPEFLRAEYRKEVRPGESINVTAVFVDNEGHDMTLNWKGCEPRGKFECRFNSPVTTTRTVVEVTVRAQDELGALSKELTLPILVEEKSPDKPAPTPAPVPQPTARPCAGGVYVVRYGEWLTKIARRFSGVETADIVRETNKRAGSNGIVRINNPNMVYAGQRIWIPGLCP